MRRVGSVSLVAALLSILIARPAPAQAPSAIDEVDYSDTFTIDGVTRTDGLFNDNSGGAYDVENCGANPLATWTPTTIFSFNSSATATNPDMIDAATGNPGAVDGVAQSGVGNGVDIPGPLPGDFSFAYGLRTDYVVEFDAILNFDRIDVLSVAGAGAGIGSANSLSVFFRRDQGGWCGIGLYNGTPETAVIDPATGKILRLGINDWNYHRFAVRFNKDAIKVTCFVDGNEVVTLDLTTFAGGIYQNYSNAAVGIGGVNYRGWDEPNHYYPAVHLWADNFAVGSPKPYAAFTASKTRGVLSVAADFDASNSYSPGTITSYAWNFGDGGTATGPTASHTYTAPGRYQATLTITDDGGNTDTSAREIVVYPRLDTYDDTFERPDVNPVDGWTMFQGRWYIESGELFNEPCNILEDYVWAGNPPIYFPSESSFDFTLRFATVGSDPTNVGRHGGFFFFASSPTYRYDASQGFCGYGVDWIDRAGDRGIRFTRWDNGAQPAEHSFSAGGTLTDPPSSWKIEVQGEHILVYGSDDGILYTLYHDVVDSTYRGGFFGFWTWIANEEMAIGELHARGKPLDACIEATPSTGFEPLTINFDGSCSANLGGTIKSYSWNFGDGATATGKTASHTYPRGYWKPALTVTDLDDNTATTVKQITVLGKATHFEEMFERDAADPIDDWTINSGAWYLRNPGANGVMAITGTTAESWVWAGDPAIVFPADCTYEYTFAFEALIGDAVGRHGGATFCADRTTNRGDAAFHGYAVDWIDRTDDRGIRLLRFDAGTFSWALVAQTHDIGNTPVDPPTLWKIEVAGDRIRIYGDLNEVPYIDVIDSTYRGGYFGFWAYSNNQQVYVDDVFVDGKNVSACVAVTDSPGVPGSTIKFSGACSQAFTGTIASYDWNFGDEATATGVDAQHAYAAVGDYPVTLTVSDGTDTSVTTTTVSVVQPLIPFADCFERAAGAVGGWTAALGDWQINADGQLEVTTAGTEAFAYAGSPPRALAGDFVAEVDWPLVEGLETPTVTIGRHPAINFFWNNATTNRFGAGSSGYSFFYIDRTTDRGFTLGRWDSGALTVLNPPGGTPAVTDPPSTVKIEVQGGNIRLYVDGETTPLIDVVDSTYRAGLFALWTYTLNHMVADNVRIGVTQAPECGEVQDAPTNLHVTGSTGKVDLAWTRATSADVQGYNVYRTVFGEGGITKITDTPLPATASTYTDTAVTAGKTYVYEVRAVYPGGESAPSNEATATVVAASGFRRGDADGSGKLDLTDAIMTLQFLYMGYTAPTCMDAADTDDSGLLDLTDAIASLQFQFMGGLPPAAPGPKDCGPDTTPQTSQQFGQQPFPPCVYDPPEPNKC